LGGRNQIYGSHEAFVTGWQNQIDNGYHSVVFGQGNILKNSMDSLVAGRGHNILGGDCVTAFGSYHNIPTGAQASNVAILGGSGLTPVASDFAVTDRLSINSRLLLLGDGTYPNPNANAFLMVEGLENVTGINGSPKSIPKVKWGELFAGTNISIGKSGSGLTVTNTQIVNNPKITLTQDGEVKGSFTLNQSNSQTINFDAGGFLPTHKTVSVGNDISSGTIFSYTIPKNVTNLFLKADGKYNTVRLTQELEDSLVFVYAEGASSIAVYLGNASSPISLSPGEFIMITNACKTYLRPVFLYSEGKTVMKPEWDK